MIEINLLPDEVRTKKSQEIKGVAVKFRWLSFLPHAAILLVAINLILLAGAQVRGMTLRKLTKKWGGMVSERKAFEDFSKGHALETEDGKEADRIIQQRVAWGEKLNELSLRLPSGVWFNEMYVTPVDLIIKGSVVSLKKAEMSLIKAFMDGLKADPVFSRDFESFELGSVQEKRIASVGVVDFMLTCKLKSK